MHKKVRRQKVSNPLLVGIENFIDLHKSWRLRHGDDKDDNKEGKDGTKGLSSTRHNDDTPPSPSNSNTRVNPTITQDTIHPSDLPKRYTIYTPMLLLGPTFLTHSPTWTRFYTSLTTTQRSQLFQCILQSFCDAGQPVTHIAANAPIQVTLEQDCKCESDHQQENVMRSPVNLLPLHGEFGPSDCSTGGQLTSAEIDKAFWVETSQVGGIKQVWAPRWTMFSRGNIREKARILGQQGVFPGLTETELCQPLSYVDVLDFYVGIGYFAFPYLRRGVRTVFGWDVNPWSIEGLRRGCERNGWDCLVVEVGDDGDGDVEKRAVIAEQVVQRLLESSPPRCVAFRGDNRHAVEVVSTVAAGLRGTARCLNIRHANLGLLPTSQGAWAGSVRVLEESRGGWLHVHENTEMTQVSEKEHEVLSALRQVLPVSKRDWNVSCENIELVKTYAPGVGHYVFDVKLWPAR